MRAKHSPAPWHLASKGGYGDFNGQSRVITSPKTDRRLAAVHVSDATTEANALLMAKSPELLEALRECITEEGAIALRDANTARRRLDAISQIARAAIAAATGGKA